MADGNDQLALKLAEIIEEEGSLNSVTFSDRAFLLTPRTHPPDIKLDEFVTDVCFHPERDIVAAASIVGDVYLYEYSETANKHLRTIEVHAKSCRDVEFSEDGLKLLSCSKDRSIMITDMETEKLLKYYENAHDDAINRLHVINENLFATGDDDGTVKVWDLRTKSEIFGLKEVEDYITAMFANSSGKLLLVTSGDGYLTTLNIGARKLYAQSEPYEEELTCLNTFRGDSKLVVGTSKGNMYSFNWGQFGYHCYKYPGEKFSIEHMIPITERICVVAGDNGDVEVRYLYPYVKICTLGKHNKGIESMDINWNGELIATSSHNNDLRFWSVKFLEDLGDLRPKHKPDTLPSTNYSNPGNFFADLN